MTCSSRHGYLSVSDAGEQLIPSLVDVIEVGEETIRGHAGSLGAQCVHEVIQTMNVAVVVIRLHLQHLSITAIVDTRLGPGVQYTIDV